ncbi:hypothetical protein FA95DRAFT_1578843 [Auriscalpium vulgare]|uniref:Uncharacterized protein n=1 Tax=Auriscalpium vulgare TaxID=40419 RepID=A0ACB8R052_9AGAM|nr:hypothetical protein FA95DRAFT_1578843 [Auriscalpium vulgare]
MVFQKLKYESTLPGLGEVQTDTHQLTTVNPDTTSTTSTTLYFRPDASGRSSSITVYDSLRTAVSRTFTAGSTNFLKAVEGVRGRWMARSASSTFVDSMSSSATGAVEITKSDVESVSSLPASPQLSPPPAPAPKSSPVP